MCVCIIFWKLIDDANDVELTFRVPSNSWATCYSRWFTVKMCMTMTLTFRTGQKSNVNMPIEKSYATSEELTIAMFVLSIIVCELFTVEMCRTWTIRVGQDQM